MLSSQGQSRSINQTSSSSRVAKADVPTLEDAEESEIIRILERYGKQVNNSRGLDIGIAYDDRSVIKRRPSSQNEGREYVIIYPKAYGSPEEVFKTFDQLCRGLLEILESEDPTDREEVVSIARIFKKHGREFTNEGWRNSIQFGNKNFMYASERTARQNSVNSLDAFNPNQIIKCTVGLSQLKQYYVYYWLTQTYNGSPTPMPMRVKRRADSSTAGAIQFRTRDFEDFCHELDTWIMDHHQK